MGPPAAAAPPCGGPTSPAAASSRRQNSDATPHSNEETSWPGPQQQSTLSTSAQDFVEQGMAVPGRKRYRNGTALAATITGALGGLAAGGPVGLLVGGAIGALAGGVHAYARTKEPPSRRRLKFLILWARLQLQEPAGADDESVSAAASLRNQRDIVDYVVVEHAPWALRLIEGLRGKDRRRQPRQHLEILVRFLQSPGVAEVFGRTNALSASQFRASWSDPARAQAVPVAGGGEDEALTAKDWHDVGRWHSAVLPTLVALRFVMRSRPGCGAALCGVRRHRGARAAEGVTAWSADFLQRHPALPPKPPSAAAQGVTDLSASVHLPPLGAEDELSECASEPEELSGCDSWSVGADSVHSLPSKIFKRYGTPLIEGGSSGSRAGGAASAGGQRPQLGGEALPRAAGAAGSSAAAPSLGELRAVLGDGSCAFGEPQHGWDEVSHEGVMVRGPRYLTDRAKVNSGPPLLETLCCDTFQVTNPDGIPHLSAHPECVVQKLRSIGERRFLFVVNWLVPPKQFAAVFASPVPGAEGADWPVGPGASSPSGELLRKFVDSMSDEERSQRFKMIAWVPEGAWLVKTAIGKTPTLLGKALKLSYFHIPGDHFEVSINVFSEPKAKSITGLVSGAAKGLVIDMGLLIEGQAPQELPEQLLGGHRLRRINFAKLRSPV